MNCYNGLLIIVIIVAYNNWVEPMLVFCCPVIGTPWITWLHNDFFSFHIVSSSIYFNSIVLRPWPYIVSNIIWFSYQFPVSASYVCLTFSSLSLMFQLVVLSSLSHSLFLRIMLIRRPFTDFYTLCIYFTCLLPKMIFIRNLVIQAAGYSVTSITLISNLP